MLEIDTLEAMDPKLLLLTSDYPPLRTGLSVELRKVTRVTSLSFSGVSGFSGRLALPYTDGRESGQIVKGYKYETNGLGWQEVMGSFDDTTRGIVNIPISGPGVYAAFSAACCQLRGDLTRDASVDISDLTYLVAFMFGGGPGALCITEADVNGDSSLDISDLTYLVAYMFGGGPTPPGCP